MERWRWLPRQLGAPSLGNAYAILNIPDFTLKVMQHGNEVWKTRVVVGKPGKHATPLLTETMKYITVNPTWNVPPSIVNNEYLPALQQDPTVLDRMGLKLERNRDGSIHISQPPGERNALGRIRFNFPNKFLVYQHDTPDKYLFAKDKRAYSHGCMRVQNPLTYAEKLLSLTLPQDHYTEARIEKMFGGSEININFPASKQIPVHLTYQTAFVDPDGKLQFRDDVYGRDQRMIAILKGERKVADIPVERPPNTSAKPVRAAPGMYGGGYDRNSGPGDFFGWIFGGNPRNQYGPPPRRSDSGRYTYR
jgi:murein L,D-transpeptidase YcbB/YkuD